MRILGSGFVGIGTASPGSLFQVAGGRCRFGDNNEAYAVCLAYNGSTPITYIGTGSSGSFYISSQGGASLLSVDQSGNASIVGNFYTPGSVGVRQASPAYPLDVAGAIRSSSGGFVFPDGSVQASAAKSITTQNNVAGSRAVFTVYQNTSGKPMLVVASVASNSSSLFTGVTDGGNPPNTIVLEQYAASPNSSAMVAFIVLPGNFYRVVSSAGSPVVHQWTEWY
jgi:hypothetical protein